MRAVLVSIATVAFACSLYAQERRGVVSGLAAGGANRDGGVEFTVRGSNPCGAVRINLGDGRPGVTHAIRELPVTVAMEYSRTGEFTATAEGMGNCDGTARTAVRVTSVRPAPPPPPPPPPASAAAARPPTTAAIRFAAMDRDGDGVITRAEWRGSVRSFEVHDWNGDGRLAGDEVRIGALPPASGGRANPRILRNWSEDQFRLLDRNGDGRITRAEWTFDLEDFYRADRNGDNILGLNEFLLADDVDDDRGDSFEYLDINGNNRIELAEWHGSLAVFERLDRNGDRVLSRVEASGSSDRGLGAVGLGGSGRREAPRTLAVSSQRAWTDTGVTLRVGDLIDVTATGRIYYAPSASEYAEAEGAPGHRATARAPVPSGDIGALVARIGDSAPFVVGAALTRYRVEVAGPLFLGVNDDVLTDNRGQFRAVVTITRR